MEIFITVLHKLAARREYKTLHEEMIHDRIVVGIRNQVLSERMQLDKKLTLESATKLVRENEAVKMQQMEQTDQTQRKDIDSVKTNQQSRPKRRLPTIRHQRKGSVPTQKMPQPRSHNVCSRCGNSHPSGKDNCPAKAVKCHKCGKTGH